MVTRLRGVGLTIDFDMQRVTFDRVRVIAENVQRVWPAELAEGGGNCHQPAPAGHPPD